MGNPQAQTGQDRRFARGRSAVASRRCRATSSSARFPEGLEIPADAQGRDACLGIVERNADDGVTWIRSYVTGDRSKTFCVYDAPSPEAIRRTAGRNELPVDRITEVRVLDPYFHFLSRFARIIGVSAVASTIPASEFELLERAAELEALAAALAASTRRAAGSSRSSGARPGSARPRSSTRSCASLRSWRVLRAACEPLHTPSPLGPFLEIADGSAASSRGSHPAARSRTR